MIITSLLEDQKIEKRIAITPEIAKKYISIGLDVSLSSNYGEHLGFQDNDYKKLGVKFFRDEKEIIANADIIVQLGLPSDDKLSCLKENQILIGVLNPYSNKEKIDNLIKKKLIISLLNYCQELQEHNLWIFFRPKLILQGIKLLSNPFQTFKKLYR